MWTEKDQRRLNKNEWIDLDQITHNGSNWTKLDRVGPMLTK